MSAKILRFPPYVDIRKGEIQPLPWWKRIFAPKPAGLFKARNPRLILMLRRMARKRGLV